MAYTTIDNPELYFQTVLYTGNGLDNRDITLPGDEDMQPDLVWLKSRNTNNYNHFWTDSVRGATKYIKSDATSAENTLSGSVKAFNSDGFRVGTEADVNNNTTTYVAWNWKAGGSASSNSDGSITSSVSASTTAGFSIVKYTGTGSDMTVGHGLNAVPKIIIVKALDTSSDPWWTYHASLGNSAKLRLNQTQASQTTSDYIWNQTDPTSSVFSLDGTNAGANANGNDFIIYCFAEKKGYSKFGSFVGNANTNGPFVYTGFRPAWVLIKNSSANGENWNLFDNKRNGFNGSGEALRPNTNEAEYDRNVDFLANGFKVRDSSGEVSGSGNTMVYLAFAESPFVNSNGVPTNAR